jgi:hypothetical protein
MVTQQVQLVEKELLTSLDLEHLVVVGFVFLIPLVLTNNHHSLSH